MFRYHRIVLSTARGKNAGGISILVFNTKCTRERRPHLPRAVLRIGLQRGSNHIAPQAAMSVGDYQPVEERDLFDMEYWSLEQAKLKVNKAPAAALQGKVRAMQGFNMWPALRKKRWAGRVASSGTQLCHRCSYVTSLCVPHRAHNIILQGVPRAIKNTARAVRHPMQVAIVSGAASGIGLVSAQTFARHGACVVALDIHADNLARAKASIKGPCLALVCRAVSRMSIGRSMTHASHGG
jgi:hypothetical protein